jgi:hypothetical protein
MQTPLPETADLAPILPSPRRRRLTVHACIALGLLALLVLGGIGTAGAIVMLKDSQGSLEGY